MDAIVGVAARVLDEGGHLGLDGVEFGELPGRTCRVVAALECRLELDRAQQELARRLIGLAAECALSCDLEHVRGRLRELERRPPVELGQEQTRLIQVVRADLQQLLVGALAQPFGELLVVLGARRLRQPRVCDFADQHVLEAVRDLAGEARPGLAREQIADEQVVEGILELVTELW